MHFKCIPVDSYGQAMNRSGNFEAYRRRITWETNRTLLYKKFFCYTTTRRRTRNAQPRLECYNSARASYSRSICASVPIEMRMQSLSPGLV